MSKYDRHDKDMQSLNSTMRYLISIRTLLTGYGRSMTDYHSETDLTLTGQSC